MTNQPQEENHEYVVFKSDQRFPCKSNSRETQHTVCVSEVGTAFIKYII